MSTDARAVVAALVAGEHEASVDGTAYLDAFQLDAVERLLADSRCLDGICAVMSAEGDWSPDTLEEIAQWVYASGRTITDTAEYLDDKGEVEQ